MRIPESRVFRAAFIVVATSLVLTASGVVGCAHPEPRSDRVVKASGPLPLAPADGQRRTQDATPSLVFDAGLGAYVVTDLPDHFFYDGYYFRVRDEAWWVSTGVDGPWSTAEARAVPPGLHRHWIAQGGGESPSRSFPAKQKHR